MAKTTRLLIITFLISLLACQNAYSKKLRKRKVRKIFEHSKIVNDHFTGFCLYDIDEHKTIYELNADKYFTPASNTKLFTFYTCLKMLGDSIPGLRYVNRNDSMIFWGTGDPSFLHTDLKGIKAFNLLKNTTSKLFFASGRYTGNFYGNAWQYDDYNDYYQAEINELPVEDNVAVVYVDDAGKLRIKPSYLQPYLKPDSLYKPGTFRVQRNVFDNYFIYPALSIPKKFRQEIPWKTSTSVALGILADSLHKTITEVKMPLAANALTIYNTNADSVYKRMLQPSDNFIAEQLLLVCASTRYKTLNTDSVINYSLKNYLADLPDKPQWADGSGLSRGNLFTPRTIVALLQKILAEVKDEKLLHSMMPIGGVAGTIKSAYKTDNGQAFVWAKTGSLSNTHNQSGYLVTRKGKRLIFSFMNNNFTRPTREIRDEMVRVMTYIHDNF